MTVNRPGSPSRSTRIPVILDADTGIDDSLALLYACASPELEVVAVTCVAGNVEAGQVAANTLALLQLVGRADVPVALGAERPLVKALQTTPETHGPRGIGYADLAEPRRTLEEEGAVQLILRLTRERPGEIHLVTLGPMTTLALALAADPALPSRLRGWTFMGGAFNVPGNTTPTSEWNVFVDPDGAKAALAGWAAARAADPAVPAATGLGLEVTERARIVPADVAELARQAGAGAGDVAALVAGPMLPTGAVAANAVLRFVVDALRFYFEFHARYDAFYGAFVHDPFVVAAVADPMLIRTREVFVDVEAGPGLAHGMTVADWRGHGDRPANVALAVEGDAATFLARLVERIGGLAVRPAARG
jgi:purine nucleosidase